MEPFMAKKFVVKARPKRFREAGGTKPGECGSTGAFALSNPGGTRRRNNA
jgi:hypothetical protein